MTDAPVPQSHAPGDRPPRVLLTTAAVGAGHASVAGALAERFAAEAPEVELESVDVLDFVPRWFRAWYAGGFALLMSRLPWLYGWGYRYKNRPHTPDRARGERFRMWFERRMLRRFLRHVERTRPELILHTHFLPAPAVGRMIDRAETDAEQMVVVTDIEVHRWWYAENVRHWFVAQPPSADPLRRWGVGPDRVTRSGIPVRAKWTQALDADALRDKWGLPGGRKGLILTGGANFTCGPVARLAKELLEACPEAHLYALAGRNEKLRRRLEAHPEAGRRMQVLGFVPDLHELVDICSLMITKSGGVTTSECLARGMPMVLLKPVPGHEQGNAEFYESRGAAVIAWNHEDVAPRASALLSEPERLERMSRASQSLHRDGAATVVGAVRDAIAARRSGR